MKELTVSAELDSRLVDEVDVAVVVVDPEGVVRRWNRQAELIYGWPAGEALGRRLTELATGARDLRLAQGVMGKVSRGETWTGDFTVGNRDGHPRTVHARIVPMYDDDGELLAMVGFSTDVTEDRRRESERRRNEQELEYLARASAILDASLDLPVTLQKLAELAVPFIGDGCMVDVRRDDGTIERFAVAAVDEPLREAFERLQRHPIDPEGEHPIARAMRTGEPQLPPAGEERAPWAGNAHHLADLRRFPGRLAMVAPITAGTRLLGTLSIALRPERDRFGEHDAALVQELARRAATVLENARLYTERAYVAETLQRSLLPASLPAVDGFDLAAVYRPAAGGTEVGGDFYDVFETCGDRWGVAIADVCGKGVEAAAVTSLARHTLRAAAQHRTGSAEMLESVNDALLRHFDGSQFCTMALGVVQSGPDAARLSLTLGGHPCPFLLHADGTVEAIGASGSLLGVVPQPVLCETPVTMRPGDALLFFTDGATEARTKRGRLGHEGLARILTRCAGLSAAEIVSHVENGIALRREGEDDDDLALLAVRSSPR